jgi:hemolysin III
VPRSAPDHRRWLVAPIRPGVSSLPTTTARTSSPRPLLRGVLHQGAFVVALLVGAPLVLAAHGTRASVAAGVFAGSVAVMLAVSTLYHRVTWSPHARLWMRRADHGGIYLLIAGTYTPIGLLDLHGRTQQIVLAAVWIGAATATLTKFFWVRAPNWLSAAIGIGLGWVGIAALPQLERAAGLTAVVLLASGGIAYTAGGIIYALRRPDPLPAIFGYHELFHALTIVALACQYVAIAFFVVRVG